ncbi:hypothetical protein DFH09DRAFT_950161 [Mycena vulgaris]|nr:hypothetical protein DFH09DRAFT_950161 [Mycena vulgaris]
MCIRWNTTNAEIERGTILEPALTRWNAELTRNLTGKKKAAATRKAKRLHLSPRDFDDLRKIADVMSILQEATLNLSKKGVPTICKVLSLYKIIEQHLASKLADIDSDDDLCNLGPAIQAGLVKLRTHTQKALVSDYPLVGAVLHPFIRLRYFKDPDSGWDLSLAYRAETILEHLYDIYKEGWAENEPSTSTTAPKPPTASPSKGIFRRAVAGGGSASSMREKAQTELQVYFSGIYPMADDDDDILGWWKVRSCFLYLFYLRICPPSSMQFTSSSCLVLHATSSVFPV